MKPETADWIQRLAQDARTSSERAARTIEILEREHYKPLVDRSARSLVGIMKVLRRMDLSPDAVEILVALAQTPGISPNELAKATGLAQSSVSQHVRILGPEHGRGKPGLGLADVVADTKKARRKIVFLTPKRRLLVERLLGEIVRDDIIELHVPTSGDPVRSPPAVG